jgi:hypothetical protein
MRTIRKPARTLANKARQPTGLTFKHSVREVLARYRVQGTTQAPVHSKPGNQAEKKFDEFAQALEP